MTTESKTFCDSCGEQLEWSPYSPAYRLTLSAEPLRPPPGGGIVYDMGSPKPIDGTKHFCDQEHLREWLTNLSSGKKSMDSQTEHRKGRCQALCFDGNLWLQCTLQEGHTGRYHRSDGRAGEVKWHV